MASNPSTPRKRKFTSESDYSNNKLTKKNRRVFENGTPEQQFRARAVVATNTSISKFRKSKLQKAQSELNGLDEEERRTREAQIFEEARILKVNDL
jgi:hypothetical protein